jgi:hypothetical protein
VTEGLFGGAFRPTAEGGMVEEVAGLPATVAEAALPPDPRIVPVRFEAGRAVVPVLLGPPAGADPDAFEAACEVLAQLHAAGRLHGMLRPEWIRRGPDGGVQILVPEASLPEPAPAFLASFGPPALGHLAPEILERRGARPESDVYALSAALFAVADGRPPLGQLGTERPDRPWPPWIKGTFRAALAAHPAARPGLEELRGAFGAFDAPAPAAPAREAPSPILVLALAFGGFFVLTGALWLAWVAWTAGGMFGRALLLGAVTLGVFAAAGVTRWRGLNVTSQALTALGTQLLFADAAFVLSTVDRLEDPRAWTVVNVGVFGLTYVVAFALKSPLLAVAAAIDALVVAVTATNLSDVDSVVAGALYWTAVSGGLALFAFPLERRTTALPFFGASALVALLGVFLAFVAMDDNPAFATVFPYAVMVALAGASRLSPGAEGPLGLAAGALLASVPWIEALQHHDDLVFLLVSVAVGLALALIGVATALPRTLRPALIVAGLLDAGVPAAALSLWRQDDWPASPELAIALVAGLALAFVPLLGRPEALRDGRLLEAGGMALFFGLLVVGSAVDIDGWLYPAVVLVSAASFLGAGLLLRRASWVAVPGAFLTLEVILQYFGKLRDIVPYSLLLLVFGIALLVAGFLFERQVRPRLREIDDWR